MKSAIFHFLAFFLSLLLGISLLKQVFLSVDGNVLTTQQLLNALSQLDFSFSSTYRLISNTVQTFTNVQVGGVDAILDAVKAVVNLITLPITLLRDIFVSVASVFSFLYSLLGFEF